MRTRGIFWIFFWLATASLLEAATSQDYFVAGFNSYSQKDYDKSIAYLQAAVQLDPRNWKAYQIMGWDYYLSNHPAEALGAFDLSLRDHPNDPQIQTLAEGIRARLIWEAERSDPYPRVFRIYDIWVRLSAGFMSASLGDLPKAASAFEAYYTPLNGHATATVDGFGPLGGLEVGFMLDTYNAWGVEFAGAPLNGYQAETHDNFGNSMRQTLQPNMVSVQAEYYRFFKLGSSRFWANAGAGFYTTLLELHSSQNGNMLQSGEVGGNGYGGFLGVGYEIAVGEQLSASVYARGRYATTGNLQGMVTYGNGATEPSVLASDDTGLVSAFPTGTTGIKAVNIDYTGADAGLAITYHY